MTHSEPALATPAPAATAEAPLLIPARLYGREAELATLTTAFAEVGSGHGQVLLVAGTSGSGKTALVQALRAPVREKNGFFLEGKFNQYQRDIPLLAIRQALGQLVRDLQAADPVVRARWRTEILQAVGDLGRLLTEFVPELELLLGPQPAIAEISPYETPHRFAAVLRRFLGVFCHAEHPVVLFIDDWQWADDASLAVLRQLQVGTTLRYLLVIASYREDEVEATHPLTALIGELQRLAVPVRRVAVRGLALAEVKALLADALQPAIEDLDGLTALVHGKTQGNPFFLRAFLDFLHARGSVRFEPFRRVWCWASGEPTVADGADDVVQLFVSKLHRLSPACTSLLSLAACIGNRFDVETLALVSECTPAACLELLQAALAQGLIQPWGDDLDAGAAAAPGASDRFMFLHDRVQQAAHSLIGPDELPGVQLRIGRLLLARLGPKPLEERLLEVADHLNAGHRLLTDDAEEMRLVELNIAAGHKARAATAYRAALHFHRAAGTGLARPEFSRRFWDSRHDLALQLYKEWAESEFLEGDRAAAGRCIQEAESHARTPVEKADALCTLIVQATLLARYPEAIAAGRRALAALGIPLPEGDFEAVRDAEIAQVRRLLGGRSATALRSLPLMTDPTILMVTKLLITMGPPCYRSHQRLWSVLVPKAVGLTLQYGHIPQVGYSHTAFGGLLGWVANDYATAREFGDLASSLMDEVFRSPSDQSVFYLMRGSSLRHWFQPLSASSQDYARAWETGLRSGNLQYAAYAFGHDMYCRFYQGTPLPELMRETQQSLDFSRTRTNQWAIDLLEGGVQLFGALAGPVPSGATPPAWSEEIYLREVEARQNLQVVCIYHVLAASSSLLLGQYAHALAASDAAHPLIYTVGTQGLLPWPEHVFTRLLVQAILSPTAALERRTAWRAEIDRAAEQLQVWATHSPANYRHKCSLARAEVARLEARHPEALQLYEQAIAEAHNAHFAQWEGWAHERAASLAQACGQARLAHVYWQDAYCCYARWGATAKLSQMEAEFLAFAGAPGTGGAAPDTAAARGQEPCVRRLEQYLTGLRAQASWLADDKHHHERTKLIDELTLATVHLREEVAERKRVEADLRQHREQLTREIQDRTVALENSRQLARRFEQQAREIDDQRRHLAEAHAAALNLMEDMVAARDRVTQAHEALQRREQDYRTLFRQMLDGFALHDIICDDQGQPRDYRFLAVNPAFERQTGLKAEAIVGRTVREVLPGTEPRWIETYGRVALTGEPASFEDYAAALGKYFAVTAFRPAPNQFATIFADITERREAQTALEQRDRELQARNEELMRFNYAVSHDLKSPLVTIRTFLGYLEKDLHKPDPTDLNKDLSFIRTAADKMSRLLDELLDITRVGRQRNPLVAVPLQAVVEEAIALVAGQFATRGVKVEVTDEPLILHGDRVRLVEVFQNLLDNACKFMGNQAEPRVVVGVARSGSETILSIRDNGMGIDPRHITKLFGLFEKLDPHSSGTGIGLALVKRIVEVHGGRIWAESEGLGKGTTFHFTLPRGDHG